MSSKHVWLSVALAALAAGYVTAQSGGDTGKGQSGQQGGSGQKPPKPEQPKPGEQKPGDTQKPPTTQPGRATPPTQGNPQDERIDTALDQLSTKIQSRQVQAGDYDAVRQALREGRATDAGAQARMQRFEQTLDTFDTRFKNQRLTPAHVDMLRQQVIDARLDQALDRWAEAAKAGKVTEAEYKAIADQLARRAEVAQSFDPSAAQMRSRLQTRLQELQSRGAATPLRDQDIADFRRDLFEQRLEHSLSGLEARAKDQDLTRAELAQLRGLLDDRAMAVKDDAQFADMHKRLGNALDALDQKVASGQVDPNEVAKLKAMLIRNAREASGTPKEKPGEKPLEKPDKPTPPKNE